MKSPYLPPVRTASFHPTLRRFFFCVFIAGALASCVLPQTRKIHAVQKGQNPPPAPPALEDWHQQSTVRFLLVHGMANHPFGFHGNSPQLFGHGSYRDLNAELANWNTGLSDERRREIAKAALQTQFDGFIEAYSRKAGLTETAGKKVPLGFEIIKSPAGKVLGYLFRRDFSPASGSSRPAVFYVACWALSAAAAKEEVYGSWDGRTISGRVSDFSSVIDTPRSSLNRMIKHGTVNWGLTDASIYVSPKGGEFEGTVAVAMQKMSADLGAEDRVAIVTASLGSTITYNALAKLMTHQPVNGSSWRMDGTARSRLRRLFFKREGEDDSARVAFYMFANQYGLLMAGADGMPSRAEVRKLAEAPSASLDRAVKAAQNTAPPEMKRRFSRRPVQLVAFTDPDDLLSYGVPKSGTSVAITNVFVRNNTLKFLIPAAGSVTNPLQAHGGYGTNPLVLQTMLKGVE